MPDMVPATKIAAIAQARVAEAKKRLHDLSVYGHSADDLRAARGALNIAIELLGLIAPPPQPVPMADLSEDGDLTPVPVEPAPLPFGEDAYDAI